MDTHVRLAGRLGLTQEEFLKIRDLMSITPKRNGRFPAPPDAPREDICKAKAGFFRLRVI